MEKCEGEAANRVLAVPKGSAIQAYQNIYLWFAGQSGMAISKRIEWVMRPPIPRDDQELAELFERWMTKVTLLEAIGPEYILALPFKLTALRILMSNRVDKFDNLKDQAKQNIPANTLPADIPSTVYNVLITKLREYLTDKRLENNFKNKDDMDIGGVGDNEEKEEEEEEEEEGARTDLDPYDPYKGQYEDDQN